jgi:hypothetical protein
MISAESIEKIQKTAVEAATPELLGIPNDPRRAYIYDRLGDQMQEVHLKPSPRQYNVENLASLAQLAATDEATKPACWVNEKTVTLQYDELDRHDTAVLWLQLSRQAASLLGLDTRMEYFDQRDFIQTLRFLLGADPAIVDKFRKIVWKGSTAGHSHAGTQKQSLGREIEGRAAGADGELPETVTVEVPFFSNPDFLDTKFRVELAIEIDVDNQAILVKPLPGEMDKVHKLALDTVERMTIKAIDGAAPVYLGNPKP